MRQFSGPLARSNAGFFSAPEEDAILCGMSNSGLAGDTPPSAMPDQEESFIWEQGPDGLTVRFPTTPAETGHMGCAVAMLVAGLLIMVPLAAAATWGLVSDSTSPQNWVAAAVGSAVAVCLL